MQELDTRALRDAFGTFMTGVTVVTTHNEANNPIGFTANSFASVSLDPPLLSVCLAKSSSNFEAITSAIGFAVNVLSQDQKDLSNTFARAVDDRFASVKWTKGPAGNPVFKGVSAWFDCKLHKTIEAGDHVILLGAIVGFEANPIPGLGYARGSYLTPDREINALAGRSDVVISALIEREGSVLLMEGGNDDLRLPALPLGTKGASCVLDQILQRSGLTTDPGFIYSVYDNDITGQQHISFLCKSAKGHVTTGAFYEINAEVLLKIRDDAVRSLLERFSFERQVNTYGIYVGTQVNGEVRSLMPGDKQ